MKVKFVSNKRKTLANIFLEIAKPNEKGYSREVLKSELIEIDERFNTKNGCGWCRNDIGIGKIYKIKRKYGVDGNKKGGKLYSLKLDGYNKNPIEKRINSKIKKEIKRKRCCILDVGQVECDHKNGKYNDENLADINEQKESDFQPLSKAANDAKREHCKVCKEKKKRYDAKRLGYKESYLYGDEDSENCEGCYWYDPLEFNKLISREFKKEY